jgi:beta-lactamase class A
MDRRSFLAFSAPAIGLGVAMPAAWAGSPNAGCGGFDEARERFLTLPGNKSLAVVVRKDDAVIWQNLFEPDAALFVGSAVKTFILATYLQQVEAKLLSEDELLPVNNDIRSLASPIFGSNLDESQNLAGEATARTVLEAMISHSDNTATDIALRRVGVDKVRAFIASAGLTATLIPQSTRVMVSYFAGAPPGVDLGWDGAKQIAEGHLPATPRSPINDQETMISTASELVSYYSKTLAGGFFSQAATLTEFRRIQAMADAIARIVPPGIAAYAKGGSVDWQDFHALCAPGQMIIGSGSVTFCFTLNWTGPDSSAPEVSAAYAKSAAGMLAAAAQCFT